jgi:hypothetical protein
MRCYRIDTVAEPPQAVAVFTRSVFAHNLVGIDVHSTARSVSLAACSVSATARPVIVGAVSQVSRLCWWWCRIF